MSTKERWPADYTWEVESPFLDEELVVGEPQEEWEPRAAVLAAESPFLQLHPRAFEEEIIDKDERTLVTDTLKIPCRWSCAIDILIDNPKWGSLGEPQFISKSRATGILIGPRYVLTARHVLGKQAIEVDGEKKSVDVKGLTVSPARNGSNSNNPFGKIKSKAVRVSQPYRIRRKVRQGSKVIDIPFQQHDDYALIILEKDLASSTHSKMKGLLGYWGHDPTVAAVRRLEPDNIKGKEIVVIGYPGDTCGKDKFSGSKSEKEKKIANCWNRRNDEWASTQWRSVGTLEVEENSTTVFHTADTYEGQSGAPICLTVDQKLYLAGIHTASDNTKRNKGVRVTRRMLKELRDWMNADAGYTIATIKDDILTVQPKTTTGVSAKEFFDGFVEDESQAEDFLDASEFAGVAEDEAEDERVEEFGMASDFESEALEGSYSWEQGMPSVDQEALYEFDTPPTPSKDITEALSNKDWKLALTLAIQAGWRDKNDLTNLIFFARHPELPPEKLDPKGPKFKQLSVEWMKILNEQVWKAIQLSAENTDLVVSGEEVTDHHRKFFRGKSGKRLKQLVEDAAREVDLNPGLLGTIMMAETRRPQSYLSDEKVSSYHIGADDFYEGRAAIKARVPAYGKIKWDRNQTPDVHDNDAKVPRKVKTILFDSGRDAVLATAVYVKFREVRLREIAAELKGDFDNLPLATRFALTRMAMAAGTAGATPFLKNALKGVDIFIRKAIPVKARQTRRNATVRTAQAMHLSDWIFGIPVPAAAAQPEPEAFEDFDEQEFKDEAFEDDAEASYEDIDHELAEEVEQPDYETENDETDDGIEARELDPVLVDLAEKTIAREVPLVEQQTLTHWTKCFSVADIAKVQKVYQDNASAASSNSVDRCSCIVMLNVALGQLLPLRLKENRARSSSDRRVQMGDLTTETIEKAMQQLRRKGYAAAPTLMNFFDSRNRTAGTLKPVRLKASVQNKVLAASKTEGCWFAFAMSIMDGYHSVLLLVDHTAADAKIYWLDQFSGGLDDDVTNSLDMRLTDKTQAWWQAVMDTKRKGYNTTIRLWQLRKPRKTPRTQRQ